LHGCNLRLPSPLWASQDRIPISRNKVRWVPVGADVPFDRIVGEHSEDADLVITGVSLTKMQQDGGAFLTGFPGIEDILFVRATQDILIAAESSPAPAPEIVVEVGEGSKDGE